jgi:hypothetical protein
LERDLPRLGSAPSGTLDRIWQAVEADLQASPQASRRDTSPVWSMPRYAVSYALVTISLAIGLALPGAVRMSTVSASVPEQPAPQTISLDLQTPTPTAIAYVQSRSVSETDAPAETELASHEMPELRPGPINYTPAPHTPEY